MNLPPLPPIRLLYLARKGILQADEAARVIEAHRLHVEARNREARDQAIEEMFAPNYWPRIGLEFYPMRANGGALVTHYEALDVGLDRVAWELAGLRIVRVWAEDGQSWIECAEVGR